MKKEKLSLKDLKVSSFVTNMEGQNAKTVRGGNTAFIMCGQTKACYTFDDGCNDETINEQFCSDR